MKKVFRIELEVEVENFFDAYEGEQKEWFDKEVLSVKNIYLHSNEIGDSVGKILSVRAYEPVKENGQSLKKWSNDIIMSAGGFRTFEDREIVNHKNRDVAIVEWTLRCLGNNCEDSDYIMEKLYERRLNKTS